MNWKVEMCYVHVDETMHHISSSLFGWPWLLQWKLGLHKFDWLLQDGIYCNINVNLETGEANKKVKQVKDYRERSTEKAVQRKQYRENTENHWKQLKTSKQSIMYLQGRMVVQLCVGGLGAHIIDWLLQQNLGAAPDLQTLANTLPCTWRAITNH